jgi:hypothetical protein
MKFSTRRNEAVCVRDARVLLLLAAQVLPRSGAIDE